MNKAREAIDTADASFDDVFASKTDVNTVRSELVDHGDLIRSLTLPRGWGVSVDAISKQDQFRLDAEHYEPSIVDNDARLRSLGVNLAPLSDFADVQLPSMFTRIWAHDEQHGVPYLNATDLMSYFALGIPAQVRYLSYASDVKMDPLIVRKGMILLSCSGTIGRVFDVPDELDGWAGTHDLVRIIPHDAKMKGFLRAYLTSEFAQIQILSHTHGGQIDHVTGEQVASCLIPELSANAIKEISQFADKSDRMRSDGLRIMRDALDKLSKVLANE
jgi:Type I restriction modification DNA specificity domain